MSRVIHTDSPGTQRQRLRRTIAEALRLLMEKDGLDDEAKDLAALIVFSLRELSAGVDRSARAWEKRNYFIKADRFRRDWEWVDHAANEMANLICREEWHQLPAVLGRLTPQFADIKIVRLTRKASLWEGCYERLRAEREPSRA